MYQPQLLYIVFTFDNYMHLVIRDTVSLEYIMGYKRSETDARTLISLGKMFYHIQQRKKPLFY